MVVGALRLIAASSQCRRRELERSVVGDIETPIRIEARSFRGPEVTVGDG